MFSVLLSPLAAEMTQVSRSVTMSSAWSSLCNSRTWALWSNQRPV